MILQGSSDFHKAIRLQVLISAGLKSEDVGHKHKVKGSFQVTAAAEMGGNLSLREKKTNPKFQDISLTWMEDGTL